MAVNINTILNWFKTGERPTQSQFWETWQSFWHKDESIPQNKIENLDTTFNSKADTENTLSFKANIPPSTDLNTYVSTGIYLQRGTASAASGSNYPQPQAGKLEVVANIYNSVTEFVFQTYHVFGTSNAIFFRTYYPSQGWQPWKRVSESKLESIPTEADLNSYIQTGVYYQNANAYAATGINYPVALAGKLEVDQSTSSSFVYQSYHVYGPNNDLYIRTKYGSNWYAWKKVVTTSI